MGKIGLDERKYSHPIRLKVAVSKCDGKEKVKISAPLKSEVLIDESIRFKTDIERF